QEYLTNQGTVVKPYSWQRQSHTCTKCPYHIRTGEEARVPYAESDRVFGFPYRSTATLQNKHLLFYELRSFSGRVVQKGHATNCTDQGKHPESMLFEVGGYLDALTDAHGNIGCVILYSNYSPCNEAYHCCLSKIYNFLQKYPEITLAVFLSALSHRVGGFPTAAGNRDALRSLSSRWPGAALQRLPAGARRYLLCDFVCGTPGTSLCQPAPLLRTLADRQNPRPMPSLTGTDRILGKPLHQRRREALLCRRT
ncbi:LOW QUALITY PROTEIN: putative C-_U-editing enzyme APOBEC-4, partial [Tyto alba]|uniref:LOW QUALITY PROTEIN: putative C->U-editing enzyme APOBEC-4 n=1 Tax=Tyto alba TaxID=56313 RepID=UPI001C6648A3